MKLKWGTKRNKKTNETKQKTKQKQTNKQTNKKLKLKPERRRHHYVKHARHVHRWPSWLLCQHFRSMFSLFSALVFSKPLRRGWPRLKLRVRFYVCSSPLRLPPPPSDCWIQKWLLNTKWSGQLVSITVQSLPGSIPLMTGKSLLPTWGAETLTVKKKAAKIVSIIHASAFKANAATVYYLYMCCVS